MKVLKKALLLLLVVVLAGAVCGVLLVRRGFRATAEPSAWESVVARTMRNLAIPAHERRAKNPLGATSDSAREGREAFLTQCAACHGIDGSGMTPMGLNLYPRVPDLRAAATQDLTDGEIHYIIENGIRFTGMPAWGAGGPNDHETWHLVLFVRHLPHLTQEDLDDMKNHNPRSPAEMKEEQQEEDFLNGH